LASGLDLDLDFFDPSIFQRVSGSEAPELVSLPDSARGKARGKEFQLIKIYSWNSAS
jgi:hypothetical protein